MNCPQIPLSMGFSRQEYWSGLPHPPPGDLSDTGIKFMSLTSPALVGGFFTTSATLEAPYDGYINMLINSTKQELSLGLIPYTLEMSLESLI